MKNNKLFELIRNFSDEEIKEIEKYLRAPFFTGGASLSKVYKEILKHKELILELNYEKLLKKLRYRLKYSVFTLNKQLSYLFREIVNYLKIKAFKNDILSEEIILNEYLLNQKTFSLLGSNLKKTSSLLESNPLIDEKMFFRQHVHNSIYYTSLLLNPGFEKRRVTKNPFIYLNKSMDGILLYSYMQAVSVYINYVLVSINVYDAKIVRHVEKLSKMLSEIDYSRIFTQESTEKKVYNIYKSMLDAFLHKEDKEYFLFYKRMVEKNINIFDVDLIKLHYDVLINYCMMQDRLGNEKIFYKEAVTGLLFDYFGKNYYKTGNVEYVNQVDFLNFVGRAYTSKKFELIKSFIENNSSKLRPTEFNDIVNYSFSYYYFGKKEYRKVLKCINSIDKNNSFIKFDMRNIELRVYYELGKIDTLIDTIHNYRKIIQNDDELTKQDKKSLFTMLKYLNILININNKTDITEQKLESEYYKRQIEKESYFSLKTWLVEKFENLISDLNERKQTKLKLVNE